VKRLFVIVNTFDTLELAGRFDFGAFSGKEILITGSSGMLGSYLSHSMIACAKLQGHKSPKLTLLVRKKASPNLRGLDLESSVKVVETELLSWRAKQLYDCLIHAASPASPTKYADSSMVFDSNVTFLKSFDEGKIPKKVLFTSSSEVYGPNSPDLIDESFIGNPIPESPRAIYPKSKLEGELVLSEMFERGQTQPYIARLFHTFGPGLREDDGRSFSDFLWAAAKGDPVELRSPGADVRTFLYLQDAVAAMFHILTQGTPGEVYNVGSETPLSIRGFAEEVGGASGVQVIVPTQVSPNQDDYKHSPNRSIIPSTKKLRGLGWSEVVPLEVGIKNTLEWMRGVLKLDYWG
jgi:UDP-glucuronate decarboxylase